MTRHPVERRSAIFVDRDGTIVFDANYPSDPSQLRLIPGAADSLSRLQKGGFLIVLISNQSGVGRGLVSETEHRALQQRIQELLTPARVTLDGAYYCPHHPDAGCDCRKPAPGLLFRAAKELGCDLPSSVMVGDKHSDVAAGHAAGCRAVLFCYGQSVNETAEADLVATDWETVERFALTP